MTCCIKAGYRKFSVFAVAILLFSGLFCWCGCNHPKNFPRVYPFKLVVTNKEQPLEGATVFVSGDSIQGGLVTTGTTDSSGIAHIVTWHGEDYKNGVPLGHYKITIEKKAEQKIMSVEERRAKNMTFEEENAYINKMCREALTLDPVTPYTLSRLELTPLEIDIQKGRNELAVDISAPQYQDTPKIIKEYKKRAASHFGAEQRK